MMMTTTTMMWWWSRVLRIQFGTSGFKCEPPEFSHFIHLFLIWSSLIANDLSLILLLWVKHSIPINIQLVMLTTSQDYISILTLSLPWVHLIRLFFCIWVLIGSQPTRADCFISTTAASSKVWPFLWPWIHPKTLHLIHHMSLHMSPVPITAAWSVICPIT